MQKLESKSKSYALILKYQICLGSKISEIELLKIHQNKFSIVCRQVSAYPSSQKTPTYHSKLKKKVKTRTCDLKVLYV